MCQLTLMKTEFKEILAPSLIHLLLENSDFKNKDGAGMFSTSAGISKTEKHFSETSWKDFFRKNTSDAVLAHVRAATFSNGGKKEITAANSHPYLVGDIVLAHNGHLQPKSDYKPKAIAIPEETDSLAFLKEVALYRLEHKTPFVSSIKETMKNYTGKFAFLAYTEQNYYVIRGKTAPLHKCTITFDKKPVGLIINTDERDLKHCLPLILHLFSFYTDGKTNYEIEEVPQNTINLVKGIELEQVETIEENSAPAALSTVVDDTYFDEEYSGRGFSSQWYKEPTDLVIPLRAPLVEALEVLKRLSISPELFDKWALATIGRPALTLDESELAALAFFIADFNEMLQKKDDFISDFVTNQEEAYALLRKITPIAAENTIHWPYELNSIAYLSNLLQNGGVRVTDQQALL